MTIFFLLVVGVVGVQYIECHEGGGRVDENETSSHLWSRLMCRSFLPLLQEWDGRNMEQAGGSRQ